MTETKRSKTQLLQRRDEIHAQLDRVNASARLELDRDLEEQSIQTEQEEVAVSMEANLRRELAVIEDRLLDFEDED